MENGYIIFSDNIDTHLIHSSIGTPYVHPNTILSFTYSDYIWNNTRVFEDDGNAWQMETGINYGTISFSDYDTSIEDLRLNNKIKVASYNGALFEISYYNNCIISDGCNKNEILLLTSINDNSYKLYVTDDFIFTNLPI